MPAGVAVALPGIRHDGIIRTMLIPMEVSPWEARQVDVLAKRHGADPRQFTVRKLADAERGLFTVRVVARGGATVYEVEDPHSWMAQFSADLHAGLFGTEQLADAPAPIRSALAGIEAAIATRGLVGALEMLNARVPHRFTAVYKLEAAVLRSVASVDKHLHLDPLDLRSVPLKDSFCQFVLRDGLFLTSRSGDDPRLAGHPYCGVMGSYVGVPVKRGDRMVGSLCHFDLVSHEVDDDEVMLLEHVAALLPSFVR